MSDPVNVEHFRGKLHTRLDQLVRRVGGVESHLRGEDGRNEADFSDRVAFTQADEVLEQLDEEGRAEIGAIRGALERMQAGTYGVCVKCGGGIATGRLEIMPEVALCRDCAA